MADPKRDGYEPPVVEQSPYQVAYVAETPNTPISSVTPDYLSELRRKAALWDAHEANRRVMISETNQWIAEVDVLWEKFKEIRKGFGL